MGFLVRGRVRIKIRNRVGVKFNVSIYHWLSLEQMLYIWWSCTMGDLIVVCFRPQCSVTCESGYQGRAVQCRQYDGHPLDDSMCSAGSRPIEHQECELEECPAPTTTPSPTTTPLPTTQPPPSSAAQPEAEETLVPEDEDIATAPARTFRSQWRTGAWTPVRKIFAFLLYVIFLYLYVLLNI